MKATIPHRPIEWLGKGSLHRAFVSPPAFLAVDSDRLQDRVVFFEVPAGADRAEYLERLLCLAWCVDTKEWCDRSFIYNLNSVAEIYDYAFGTGATGEMRLLETGAGGHGPEAVGVDRIHYARADEVDLFVTPKVAARLRELLDAVELLYVAEPKRSGK